MLDSAGLWVRRSNRSTFYLKSSVLQKKVILEEAIRQYSDKIASDRGSDPSDETFGIGQREESADQIIRKTKDTVRATQERHKR
jgi:hypothetical protein